MVCPVARTCRMALRRRYSKASTAEDGLPHPDEQFGALAGLSVVSIAAPWGVTQRVYEYGSHLRIGCRLYLRRLPVPVWGRSEIHKHDGNSVRTEPVVASETREIPVRRFLDSGSDKLFGRGNLSNGIPGRCGTKGIRGETLETSEPVCFILNPEADPKLRS